MRPRPDAAENAMEIALAWIVIEASMRPRPDAAENGHGDAGEQHPRGHHASMRPRPDAAENARPAAAAAFAVSRFNEAAARCRGKRVRVSVSPAAAEKLQ